MSTSGMDVAHWYFSVKIFQYVEAFVSFEGNVKANLHNEDAAVVVVALAPNANVENAGAPVVGLVKLNGLFSVINERWDE